MELALEILALVAGFYFLAKGSDWLVTGASVIAERAGVRPLIVGLTVVAWGTSAPEVVVSGRGALVGEVGVTMGNVLGSNVANIGLVLGTCTLVLPAILRERLGWREVFWLLCSLGILWWGVMDLEVSRFDGAVFLGAMLVYNLQLLWEARQASIGAPPVEPPDETWFQRHPRLAVLIGMLAIFLAAEAVMFGAMGLAMRAGLSTLVISLTVVAVGTSLPELAAGLSGAFKGQTDISIGNVVGSNVFNLLGVVGVVALIHPFGGSSDEPGREVLRSTLALEFPVVLGFSLAAVGLPMVYPGRGRRIKGGVLLLGWVGYTVYLLLRD